MYLERISSPADVRALPASAIPALCAEIRTAIIESSAHVGGHVGPNLGVVELTVALHRVFDSPADKLVFDVSHQTYAHKMLTGRARAFLDPALMDSVSGFSSPRESEHDHFAMGHTSTSVSLAVGLAKARDLAGGTNRVVAVIGDGSLSGGLAFEGLDNAAELGSGLIIVVNDNEWSISEDHGGIYGGLSRLRKSRGTSPDNLFRAMGLDYRYLEEGNDEAAVEAALLELRDTSRPVVLHVHTTKGLGFAPALADEESWHHVGPFDPKTGERRGRGHSGGIVATEPATYADITGEHLLARMRRDRSVVAISSATPYMMGFTPGRRRAAGAQFVDVGIAEEHAVTFATGLAAGGAKPVWGVYGTFLQRTYDQLWHDLCLNAQPATILVFGSSAFGTTDATHLGFYDVAMLGDMPGLTYLAPTCREEYLAMLDWAIDWREGPVAIRVPGAGVVSRPGVRLPEAGFADGAPEIVRKAGADGPDATTTPEVTILALGSFLPLGEQVADELAGRGVAVELVNPRYACGLSEVYVQGLSGRRVVVTLEDGVLEGGFGERVARQLGTADARVRCYGLPHGFPDRYEPEELLASCDLTAPAISRDVMKLLSR